MCKGKKLKIITYEGGGHFTGGLIGSTENDFLPSISPSICLFLTLLFIFVKFFELF